MSLIALISLSLIFMRFQSVQLRLEAQFAMLDRHPFYSPQSFEENAKYELWREQQRVRIRKTQTKIEQKLVSFFPRDPFFDTCLAVGARQHTSHSRKKL